MDRQDISSIIASYINSNDPLDYQKDINVVSERILSAIVHQEKEEGLISEFNTPALIEELKYRSPNCEKCQHINESVKGDNCFYCYWVSLSLKKDNFKEANHGKV